ncbi:hypothetical protein CSC62_08225 [Pseudoxanthomonas jiangsuensis]|uniref:DUF6766 family protein n=1 Tax=Pseudoxanthomonas jiangsuensis TaxID=619688 RepID=UPI001391980F|nr:DUF6766 family protein [Pseudoxanthomonas jiangsuensis]KAF1697907.1 hypothetical protein CSC62_08225 [Pseudoxanthomonas jiangsuensis]
MPAEYSFWKRNGLSLVLAALFLAFWIGQILTGQAAFNEERAMDGLPPLALLAYVTSGHAISATFENWESEFLQMGMYVLLTVWLRQQGSAESRPLDPARDEEEIEPGPTPWPARAGGLARRLYANSLSLAFLALFAIAFVLHGLGSWKLENEERAMQGQPPVTLLEHVGGAQFWFESMQNWQSEFLAVLSIVVLSIWLRQDRSPESKPVAAPHMQTGA